MFILLLRDRVYNVSESLCAVCVMLLMSSSVMYNVASSAKSIAFNFVKILGKSLL